MLRVESVVRAHCYLVLEGKLAALLTWWFWLWVLYSSLILSGELSGLSSSILLLSHWMRVWYSSSLMLDNTKGDLSLCVLMLREWSLTSSKLLFKLNMAPMRSVTMSISSLKTTFKELKLIISEGCVIFPKSLIGATIQDGGKRERKNVLKFLSFAISNFSCYFTFVFIFLSSSATTSFAFSRSFSLFQLIMLHYKPFPLYQILYDLSYFSFI